MHIYRNIIIMVVIVGSWLEFHCKIGSFSGIITHLEGSFILNTSSLSSGLSTTPQKIIVLITTQRAHYTTEIILRYFIKHLEFTHTCIIRIVTYRIIQIIILMMRIRLFQSRHLTNPILILFSLNYV